MKKLIAVSLLGFLGATLVGTAALANYGKDNSLSGYIKEYKTLKALPGAKVKLYKKSGSLKDSDTANKRGKYKFSDLKEGTYRVKVRMDGYRNPKDMRKDSVSSTVKVDGSDRKNLYLQKAI